MTNGPYRIVGIGEVLWDMLPTGKQLGGAPANFAYIANALGDEGIIASRVGNDANGFEIIERLKVFGLSTRIIQHDNDHQSGTVHIKIENGQPSYKIVENVAWDFLELTPEWIETARTADAICFGSLAQRSEASRSTISRFIGVAKPDALRIFDVNLRQSYYSEEILKDSLAISNVVKLNHEELPIVAEITGISGHSPNDTAKYLLELFNLRLVCVTCGADGSILITKGEIANHAGIPAKVADTVGAGDAFTATLAHGLLRNWDLVTVSEKANRVAAFVASRAGAMPQFSKDAKWAQE